MKLYEVEIDEKNPIKQTVNVIEGDKFILSWISKIPGKKYTVVDEAGKKHIGNNAKLDGKTQTLEVRNSKNTKVLCVQVIAKRSSVRDVDGITENDITRVVNETTGLNESGISKEANQNFIVTGSSAFSLNQGQTVVFNGVEADRFRGVIINEGGFETLTEDVEIPMYAEGIYGNKITTYIFTGGADTPNYECKFKISSLSFINGQMTETKKRVSFSYSQEMGTAFVMLVDWGSFVVDSSHLLVVLPQQNWAVVHATVQDIAE